MGKMSFHLTQFCTGSKKQHLFSHADHQAIFHPRPDSTTESLTLQIKGAAVTSHDTAREPYMTLLLQDSGIIMNERRTYAERANKLLKRKAYDAPEALHISLLRITRNMGEHATLLREIHERIDSDIELTFGPTKALPQLGRAPANLAPLPQRPQAFFDALRRSYDRSTSGIVHPGMH